MILEGASTDSVSAFSHWGVIRAVGAGRSFFVGSLRALIQEGTQEVSKRILRLPEVEKKTGIRKSKLYAEIAKGRFPRQVALTGISVGWLESSVDAWIDGLAPVGKDSSASQRAALAGRHRHKAPKDGRAATK